MKRKICVLFLVLFLLTSCQGKVKDIGNLIEYSFDENMELQYKDDIYIFLGAASTYSSIKIGENIGFIDGDFRTQIYTVKNSDNFLLLKEEVLMGTSSIYRNSEVQEIPIDFHRKISSIYEESISYDGKNYMFYTGAPVTLPIQKTDILHNDTQIYEVMGYDHQEWFAIVDPDNAKYIKIYRREDLTVAPIDFYLYREEGYSPDSLDDLNE